MHTNLQILFSLRDADGRARLCILVSECLKAVYTALTTAVFLTGFLMCSGLDSVEIGYITALPLISGVLYPFSPLLLEKFRKRKALLGGFRFAYHFFTIFGITVLPLVWRGPGLVQVLMICMLLGSAANTLVASGFPAWHITFLPEEIRGSFFALSGVLNSMFTALAALVASILSDFAASSGNQLFWLGVIRMAAFILALLELGTLLIPRESPYPPPAAGGGRLLALPLCNTAFMRTMLLVFFWMFFSTMTLYAANVYLLDQVKVSYTFLSVLQAMNIVVTAAVMPLWHRLLRRTSWFKTFNAAFYLFALYPILHAFVTSRTYLWLLPVTMVVYQAVLAGGTFCFSNMAYVNTPKDNRTVYLSYHLMLVALGSLGGQGAATLFLKLQKMSLHFGVLEFSPAQQLLLLQAGLTLVFATWCRRCLLSKLECVGKVDA